MKKGTYYLRIVKIFSIIAVVLSLVLIIVAILTIKNFNAREEQIMSSALMTQRELLRGTLSYIKDSINRLVANENVSQWADSEWGDPNYYFYSLKLYQATREETTFQDYLDYTISITNQDPKSFVISSDGTIQKNSVSFSPDEEILKDGVFIPGIYRSHKNNSLLLVTNRRVNDTTLTFLSTFRLPDEMVNNKDYEYCIHDQNRDTTISSSEKFENSIQELKWQLDGTEASVSGYYCIVDSYTDLGFSVIYAYKEPAITSITILIIFCAIVFVFIAMLTLYLLAQKLYKPVGETLSKVTEGEEVKDEFKVITEHCKQIETLSLELEDALKEQKMLSEQQKYRAFLRGVPYITADNDESSYFTVAAVMFECSEEELNLLFAKLDNFSKQFPHVHFVRMNFIESAIVAKADNSESSKNNLIETLKSFSFSLNEKIELRCALSSTNKGYQTISKSYKRASDILSYRYRFRNKTILTEDDVKGEEKHIVFPLSEFNKLITALLASSPEALSIFDNVVERNTNISFEEYKRFTFTMIGIVIRYFQELRTTPEELFGESIDWSELYSNSDPDKTLKRVRSILAKAMQSNREKEVLEESDTLKQMKDYINEHCTENIMLIDLANEFNLTPKYCSQLFSQLSNENFKSYLNRLKISKACKAIEDDPEIKISALSLQLGFTSANTFIRVFSKYMGITPKLYAEKIIKDSR